jgi:3',5'-cyclic AMP phosphodiesterase CpdA
VTRHLTTEEQKVIVIAHLSDTHIDVDGQNSRSIARTRTVMNHLENLPHDLDAVLVTGDIADHGRADEYEQARELLTSRHPVVICPGNHDERAAFRRELLGQPAQSGTGTYDRAPVNQVLRLARCVIAACDSSIPGRDEGYLEDQTLSWLEDVLREAPRDLPVLIAFHHPPEPLGIPFIDGIRLRGAERLASLARQYPNIAGYLCGHAHTAAAAGFAGRPLRAAPAVVSTLRLPWEPQSRALGHVRFDHPPALAYHVLDDQGRLTTHYRCVTG